MDQDTLAPVGEAAAPSWRLRPGTDAAVQGLVVSGFGHLPAAQALFMRQTAPGGDWLATLNQVAPITDATGRAPRASSVALTSAALALMGVDVAILSRFDLPFQQGMHAPERRRRLGDADPRTIAEGGVRWSGSQCLPVAANEVHALLLLYGSDADAVTAWADEVVAALDPQLVCVHRLSLDLHQDEHGISREHFGFADGLSQPIPHGAAIVGRDGQATAKDQWHGIESGDILLGHLNAYGDPAPGPYFPDGNVARDAGLLDGNAPPGFLDLGLNGSYLVVRELQQDVAGFWQDMDRCAAAGRTADPSAAYVTAEWIAERVIGRTLVRGDLVQPPEARDDGVAGRAGNATGFLATDPHGYGCPMGAHVRRANPRDGLAGAPEFGPTVLEAANNHRLLRRGRKFGAKAVDPRNADDDKRGLLFMCLNTDIARQFEFVQQTWLLNPNFATLRDQVDPLIGPVGPFTIPQTPLRRQIDVRTYVRLAGGEYFFLPSLPALRFLACLRTHGVPI